MPSERFHVFLSHNSADKPAVEEIARLLRKDGLESWLDKWHLVPGEPWQQAIETALAVSESVAVFVGPSGFGPWQNEEMRAALARRVSESDGRFRVIPVLLPGGTREERSKLPTFLVASTWVEYRKSIDEEDAYHRLKSGILGIAPGAAPGEAVYEGQCPYRGLQAFQPEHAAFFFGREARIEWLLNALRPASQQAEAGSIRENRFLGIIGASGSGKSSLARAGLVPALRQGKLEGSADWPIVTCRPGQDPLESLAVALSADAKIGTRIGDVGDLIERLATSETRLHLTTRVALDPNSDAQRVVILVDQFEEVFTLCSDEARRKAFIDNLIYAAGIAGGKTIVVLTMRADFYGKCALYPNLATALTDHQELVGPMTDQELREVIERPAQLVGLELEPGLVEMLLRDMKDQPGALPLLQHAMLELWQRRVGRRLTIAAYQAIGGLEGALEQQANAVFDGLSAEEQETCRRIFLRLTQPGEGSEDTKRRVALTQLGDSSAINAVVQRLANVRLITTEGESAKTSGAFVEVSHEALIRSWSKLRKWIDADRESLRTQHRLTQAAAEWEEFQRDAGYLYQGARLAEAEEWSQASGADQTTLEREFLAASIAQRDQGKREEEARRQRELEVARELAESHRLRASEQAAAALRSKQLSGVALGLAAIAIIALGWAMVSRSAAVKSARVATLAKQEIEETLANNLLERIHSVPGAIGVNEFSALWQLASLPIKSEPLRLLVLKLGLEQPAGASSLSNRAVQSALAIVGLNPERRQAVLDKSLLPLLQQESTPQINRLAAARLALALKAEGTEFAKLAAPILSTALVKSADIQTMDELASDLNAAVKMLSAEDAERTIAALVNDVTQTTNPQVLSRLKGAILAAPVRLTFSQAKQVSDQILSVMEKDPSPEIIHILSGSGPLLPGELDADEADRVVKYIVDAIGDTGNIEIQKVHLRAMQAVVLRIPKSAQANASTRILTAMKEAEESESTQILAECLVAVAVEISLTDLSQATKLLLNALQQTEDAEPLLALASGFKKLHGALAASDLRTARERVLQVLEKSTTSSELLSLAQALVAIPQMPTDTDVSRATARLMSLLTVDSTPPDTYYLSLGIQALPGSLSDADSRKALDVLLAKIDNTRTNGGLKYLADAFVNLGPKLSPREIGVSANQVVMMIANSKDSDGIRALSRGMRAVAEHVPAETTTRMYDAVLAKMQDPQFAWPIDLALLAESLALLPGMTPEPVANAAIERLSNSMSVTTNTDSSQFLVNGLGAVAGNISKSAGHAAITKIIGTIEATRDSPLWRVRAQALASVVIELEKEKKFTDSDATAVVKNLAWAMDTTTDEQQLKHLAEALALIAPKLPKTENEITRLAIKQILISIRVSRDPDTISVLSMGWQGLAERMTEQEVRDAFRQIATTIENPGNAAARESLSRAAVALAKAPMKNHAVEALRRLLSVIHGDHDPAILTVQLNGIAKLSARIDPSDVEQAKSLIVAMTAEQNRMNDQILSGLVDALDALPGTMDKSELVELLKSPFCTGPARTKLLSMITSQAKQPFDVGDDPWKLVAKAEEAGLDPRIFREPVQQPKLVPLLD